MKRIVLILFLTVSTTAFGQIEFMSAFDLALAGSTVASQPKHSPSNNVAFIPDDDHWKISLGALNKFYIKELSPVFFDLRKSIKEQLALVFGAGRMGNASYEESFAEAAIGKKLGSKFSAGVRVQYHQWKIHDSYYKNSTSLIPSICLFAQPLKNLCFGAIILNPVRSRMNAIEKNKLPSRITSGINYRISEKATVSFSLCQQNNLPLSCQFGVEYVFSSVLFLRCGLKTVPVSQTFGFGLRLSKLFFDLGVQTHSYLGSTTSVGLSIPL